MTADDLTVAGIRFRTRADYEAALRDQKKINAIRARVNLDDPKELFKLFSVLQGGSYRFETQVGNNFDDDIYEKVENLKKQGITPGNTSQIPKEPKQRARHFGKAKKVTVFVDKAEELPENNKGKELKARSGSHKKSRPMRLEDYDKVMQRQILDEIKKRERRRKIVVGLSSLVAIGSFAYFGVYYYYAARTSADYESLASLKNSTVLSENQTRSAISLHRTGELRLPDVLDEYKTLYQKNKKLIGWLKIDDTKIDYPVMQTSNNEYYLDHNYNQEYDKNGSIFLDSNCSIYPRSTNLIVYGHHMKSGKMFGQLQMYARESYSKEHALIQFDSIYEKGTYQVMYVFRSQVYNEDDFVFKYYQFIDANSEAEFDSYMKEMAAVSLYDTEVTANYGDSLLTLSTCDSSQEDGRFVVVAKKIG